jgi:hypothetical protein
MYRHIGMLGALAVAVNLMSSPKHRRDSEPAQTATMSPCTADSGYQRLAFWVGDWDVYDSTGAPYATQRVRAVIDECAITAEWADPSYTGPGIRFISLPDPAVANPPQTRVTIMPLSGHRVLQEFEDSRDGGKTWKIVFKGEHRSRIMPAMSPPGSNPSARFASNASLRCISSRKMTVSIRM